MESSQVSIYPLYTVTGTHWEVINVTIYKSCHYSRMLLVKFINTYHASNGPIVSFWICVILLCWFVLILFWPCIYWQKLFRPETQLKSWNQNSDWKKSGNHCLIYKNMKEKKINVPNLPALGFMHDVFKLIGVVMVLSAFLEHKHFGGNKYIPNTTAPSVAPRHVEMKYTEHGP